MTLEKRGKGKYKVQLVKNFTVKKPIMVAFSFESYDGISSAVITIK